MLYFVINGPQKNVLLFRKKAASTKDNGVFNCCSKINGFNVLLWMLKNDGHDTIYVYIDHLCMLTLLVFFLYSQTQIIDLRKMSGEINYTFKRLLDDFESGSTSTLRGE